MILENLDQLFDEAFENANLIPQESVPQDLQLVLYGLYKQASSGKTQQPNASQDMIDLRHAFKTNAWMQVKHLSQNDAKTEYIKIINDLLKEQNENL